MDNKKDPNLKFRYAQGLGDLIACFLHSKAISWLTYIITGTKEPCQQCSTRRQAWNTVLPIKFWRLFFEDQRELMLAISEDYKNSGYDVNLDINKLTMSASKANKDVQEIPEKIQPVDNTTNIDDYVLASTSINKYDNIMLKIQIYKKKK
jgi:hypothetical protein